VLLHVRNKQLINSEVSIFAGPKVMAAITDITAKILSTVKVMASLVMTNHRRFFRGSVLFR
jgi:hypothetical protein